MISSTPNVRVVTVQPSDEPGIRSTLTAALKRLEADLAKVQGDAPEALLVRSSS